MAKELSQKIIEFVVAYAFQAIGAVIILFVGIKLSQWLPRMFVRFCQDRKLDITITNFFAGVLKALIIGFAAIVALGNFGITIAPFVAAIGALAFGGTMAIQGPLSNYGAGVSLLLTRPFRVGDTITVQTVSGTVEDIKLACTVLMTEDRVRITIPNKQIVGEILFNTLANRVVDARVGISYGSDPAHAIDIIRGVLKSFPQIASEPPPQIGISGFGDSSIDIEMRYWVPPAQYVTTRHAVNLAVWTAFKREGVSIPFPQREVRIIGEKAAV